MHAESTPVVGQPSAHGHAVTCIWCGWTDSHSQHLWCEWEDARGWECENESACHVRFDARHEATS
jgi:hypothetical protein